MGKEALSYKKSELKRKFNVNIKIMKTKPSNEFTGTVLLIQKGNNILRFIKHDKSSWGIAKYTVNGRHTTSSDMIEDIESFLERN